MVQKEIKWSSKAVSDKFEILDYWLKRTGSYSYSRKLDSLFDQALELVYKNPELGKRTDNTTIRIKIVSHYLLFYRVNSDTIEIVRIRDSRRKPGGGTP